MPTPSEPAISQQEAEALAVQAARAFSPRTPVSTRAFFAGRWNQITTLVDAVSQTGLHVVIFGERGVGKSSLANMIRPLLQVMDAATPRLVVLVNAHQSDTFSGVWAKALDEVMWDDEKPVLGFQRRIERQTITLRSALGISDDPTMEDIRRCLIQLPEAVFVFDEFDRLPRRHAAQFTDLMKVLSDRAVPVTIVIVGVGDTVDGLVKDHASIARALVQIQLPRMNDEELKEILEMAAGKLGITIDPPAASRIARLSQGLPHYTHLVGLHAVRTAAKRHSRGVTTEDVEGGFAAAVRQSDHTIAETYDAAVHSAHASALYRHVLLACAVSAYRTARDSVGYFQAASVVEPLAIILGREVQIATFNGHLTEFCTEKRGNVLERRGGARAYRYRFSDPLMPPYVVMRGLADEAFLPAGLEELLSGDSPR